MRKMLAVSIAIMMLLVGCTSGETAKQATENTLNAIKNMDEEAISNYIDEGVLSEISNEEKSKELAAIIFKKLSYEIIDVTEKGDSATAQLKLTNVNMVTVMGALTSQLFEDAFASAMLPEDQQPTAEETEKKINDALIQAINAEDAERITSEVTLSLEKKDGVWSIQATDEFVDGIMGGMLSLANSMVS